MVENLRRLNIQLSFKRDTSILQTRGRLLATALLIRCELCVFSDFVKVYREQKPTLRRLYAWMREDLNLDLSQRRSDCLRLAESSKQGQQPMQEIEARFYLVRFVVLGRTMPAIAEDDDATNSCRPLRMYFLLQETFPTSAACAARLTQRKKCYTEAPSTLLSRTTRSAPFMLQWLRSSEVQAIGTTVRTVIRYAVLALI